MASLEANTQSFRPELGRATPARRASPRGSTSRDGSRVYGIRIPPDSTAATANPIPAAQRKRKTFILCFDGTGNKFSGTGADSNILKIFRVLDRNDDSQFHYYQPGIGTYVTATSLTHTSRAARMKSAYIKAKDAAIGTSFADHVMGGYKFLMRYYSPGDDIFFFGFSRGAYTARFLAEMLDHVGLLSAGNEEMARFAWKTFQKWQIRQEGTAKERAKKKYLLDYMIAFRETFARPVRRIRFLGLFDTVNSVPRFENAWMQRSKFPYTAHSTAKVIRHAVSIDERRAKFRQDLISQDKKKPEPTLHSRMLGLFQLEEEIEKDKEAVADPHLDRRASSTGKSPTRCRSSQPSLKAPKRFRNRSRVENTTDLGLRPSAVGRDDRSEFTSASRDSFAAISNHDCGDDDSEGEEQDIQEVWFAGCHADIGGGWPLADGEHVPLAHVPLVWMIREAERAGLRFDPVKLCQLNCCPEDQDQIVPEPQIATDRPRRQTVVPEIEIEISAASPTAEVGLDDANTPQHSGTNDLVLQPQDAPGAPQVSRFSQHLHLSETRGHMHDVLRIRRPKATRFVPLSSTLAWNAMEYLPFRRMDLQSNGMWKPIAWPLPKGEVRDVPDDVIVHGSVLRRMKHDESYRPGNLIVGGGGRGIRIAPKEYGMGKWRVLREEGDPVGECWVRAEKPVRTCAESSGSEKTPLASSPGGMAVPTSNA